jgi:hypothetical protein
MSFKVGPLILQENANLVEEVLEVLLPLAVKDTLCGASGPYDQLY